MKILRLLIFTALLATSAPSAPASRLIYGSYLPNFSGAGSMNGTAVVYSVSVAADRTGNSYIAATIRTNVPMTPNSGASYTFDAYVSKISSDGRTIVLTTVLRNAIATDLALDVAGNIVLVGTVNGNFATTAEAFQTDSGSGFIAKLAPNGSFVYSSRISASPTSVALDAAGSAYITGSASSDFKTTPGVVKPDIGAAICYNKVAYFACDDAFVAKVSGDGSKLVYATFLGGTSIDSGLAIAVDQTGSAYVVGETLSSDFPVTAGALQTTYGGTMGYGSSGGPSHGDGFAVRLDPSAHAFGYSTFLGGPNADQATGIAVDLSQNAYVTGTTRSRNFPVTAGAYQPVYGGDLSVFPGPSGDSFFVKFGPSGQAIFSSYLGGPGEEKGGSIAMGTSDRMYVTVSGPVIRALDHHPSTPCDPQTALVAIDRDSGKVVDYFGVEGIAIPASLSVDGSGLVHLSGSSARSSDPFAVTPGAVARSGSGYLARVDFSQKDQFVPACLANAASYALTRQYSGANLSAAPGEIISIFGSGLGPAVGISALTGVNGIFPRGLAGTSVQIGNTSLPLLYVSGSQVNAIAPYSLNVGTSTLTVQHDAFQASYEIEVAPAFPGVFTLDGSGHGPAAILNQDGSVNSPDKPASPGSVVSIFCTGMGHLTEPLPDDLATPLSSPWPQTTEPFGVYTTAPEPAGAAAMEISYAGPAPGLPPGVYQINAQVPIFATGRTLIRFAFAPPGYDQSQYDVYIFVH